MSQEGQVAERSEHAQTRASLGAGLRALGVGPGSTVLVHASLSALGWVAGGEVAVVQALLDAVGPAGTLVVPTQTGGNSDPESWGRPPVPQAWWPVIRAEMPAYEPALTPSRGMGRVAELVRTWPQAQRSTHPQNSFAAVGAQAVEIVARHDLEHGLGEGSPLATLERLAASVLFLGTDWSTCTALHLAQYRVPAPTADRGSCAVLAADGSREWITYDDVDLDANQFAAIGAAYEDEHPGRVVTGRVGAAPCRFFALAEAVGYAVSWLAAHPVEGSA